MKDKQEKKIKSFVKFLFNENKDLVNITIMATSRKTKRRHRRKQLGSRVDGITFRRQDYVKQEESE
jgi:hypothetical protein